METPPLLQVPTPAEVTRINEECWISDVDGMRTVLIRGIPVHRYELGDSIAERYAAVALVDEAWAEQQEVAAALGRGVSTVRRWQRRHDQAGVCGLVRKKRRTVMLKMDPARDRIVRRRFEEGWSNCAIARQLRVHERTVRYALKRLGLKRERAAGPPPCLLPESSDADLGAEFGSIEPEEEGSAPRRDGDEHVEPEAPAQPSVEAHGGPGAAPWSRASGEPRRGSCTT